MDGHHFGVYVHVPFCSRRCDYCAFATWTDRHHLVAAYVEACVAEVRAAELPDATSTFLGGGTPSLLPAAHVAAIVGAIDRRPDAEVTLECNPEDVSAFLVDAYRAAGVTRISLGVQSMRPHVLAGLGRHHRPGASSRAMEIIRRAGLTTWSVDLIHGGAGESMDDWRETLDEVMAFEPPHVSVYSLTVEPGTALAADPSRHPDDDEQADKYMVADEVLHEAGLRSYEVSNWARPGHECRHNSLYWSQGDYRGIGCAAHSHQRGRRWWNVRSPERYVERIRSGRSPVAGEEALEPNDRRRERLQLALRTSGGVPASAMAAEDLDELDGLVEERDGRLVLTVRGRLLGNEVALRLR